MNSYVRNFKLLLVLFSGFSFAQINDTILFKKILHELKLKENDVCLEMVADKVLPYSESQSVFVIPKYVTKEEEGYGNYYWDLDAYIVIVDRETGKISSQFFESNAWTSDAIRLSGISIDTGLYILNSETRAFGVRVSYTGSSRPNPYNETDFSLFVPKGKTIKRVLKDFVINEFHGEWDTNCSGKYEETSSTIEMDKTSSNGYRNLNIKSKTTNTISEQRGEDCIDRDSISKTSTKLKYNGKEYQ